MYEPYNGGLPVNDAIYRCGGTIEAYEACWGRNTPSMALRRNTSNSSTKVSRQFIVLKSRSSHFVCGCVLFSRLSIRCW